MTAPNSAYILGTLPLKFNDSTYNHQLAIGKEADRSLLKNRFYLDEFITKTESGNGGFVGLCIVNGLNSAMHNSNRVGAGRIEKSGIRYLAYADAGLNTLAYSDILDVKSLISNRIILNYFIKSAWYADTTQYGIQIRLAPNGTWYNFATNTSLSQATENISDQIFASDFENEPLVDIRPYAVNAEGTFYGSILTRNLLPPQFGYAFDARTSSCVAGSQVLLYMLKNNYLQLPQLTENATVGANLLAFYDADRTQEISNGLYAVGNQQYQYSNSLGFVSKITCETSGGGGGNSVNLSVTLGANGVYTATVASTLTYTVNNTINAKVAYVQNNSDTLGTFDFSITLPANTNSATYSDGYNIPEPITYDGVLLQIISVSGTSFTQSEVTTSLYFN